MDHFKKRIKRCVLKKSLMSGQDIRFFAFLYKGVYFKRI